MNTYKKLNFLTSIIIALFSATIVAKCTKFPCQKPHRFSNREFTSGQYYLSSLIFSAVPNDLKLNYTADKKNYTITPDKIKDNRFQFNLHLTYNLFFTVNDTKGNKLIITRYQNREQDKQKYPDAITFYLFNKKHYEESLKTNPKKIDYGTKIIFDVDKFERFMTQTYDFDNLKGKESTKSIGDLKFSESAPDLGSIILSLNFDPITFTTNDPNKSTRFDRNTLTDLRPFSDSPLRVAFEKRKLKDILERQYMPGVTQRVYAEFFYDVKDIEEWNKNAPGTSTYENDRATYQILYDNNIIQKLSITESDFNILKNALLK